MKRGLSTGGAILLFKPISESVAEAAYQQVVEALALADKLPEDRIKALLSVAVDDLWQKVPMSAPMQPSIDGDIIPGSPDFLTVASKNDSPAFKMPGRKWCKAFMIGDSKLDVRSAASHVHDESSFAPGEHSCISYVRRTKAWYRTKVH